MFRHDTFADIASLQANDKSMFTRQCLLQNYRTQRRQQHTGRGLHSALQCTAGVVETVTLWFSRLLPPPHIASPITATLLWHQTSVNLIEDSLRDTMYYYRCNRSNLSAQDRLRDQGACRALRWDFWPQNTNPTVVYLVWNETVLDFY